MIEGNRSPAGMFTPGEALSAAKLNKLAEMASQSRTTVNTGIKTTQGPFGTVYDTDGGQVIEQTYDFPFKVSLGFEDNGAKVTVFVRPGTVNNRMPKIGSDYLDKDTPPKLEFTGFSFTNKKIVALKVTKDGVKFFPQTVEVVLLDDEEALTDTDTQGYLQIATISGKNESGKPKVSGLFQLVYASQIVVRTKAGTTTAIWTWTSR